MGDIGKRVMGDKGKGCCVRRLWVTGKGVMGDKGKSCVTEVMGDRKFTGDG